ncbi:glycosyltransferase family 4 protein [Undibacterium sp. WLHG33]|uniref:glycosyltransferase family 4 protein n=1 Tax=Undibacterium sp. WLHG33 TaxID=3412482 RepID=UPI003C2E5A22
MSVTIAISKPQIGLIVPSLMQGGGVPSVARFLKDSIIKEGSYRLKIISLATSATDSTNLGLTQINSWRRGAIVEKGEWEGLPFIHVGANAGEFEFQRYQPRLILKNEIKECDILQIVCGSPAWANTVIGQGKPVSLQCATRIRVERRMRDSNAKGLVGHWRKIMTSVSDRLDDRALKLVDAIQVENPWMLEYSRGINNNPAADIKYAPPGVDCNTFYPDPNGRNLEVDPYILCVARLSDPRKNVGLLLEAYALLPKDTIKNISLVLAGSSSPPEKFWKRVQELGLDERVKFVLKPSEADLVRLYQRALMFVLPSDEEGLGVVILEAMACGIPPISTKSGGPDGIISDGFDGFLTALNDEKSLCNKILLLSQNLELNRAMGFNALKTVLTKYEQGVAAKEFYDTWNKLMRKMVK